MPSKTKTGDLVLGDRKPLPDGPYYVKIMRNNVIAPTLVNLKALKHAKFSKGSSTMHKTTQNQRFMFTYKPQRTIT